MLKGYLNKNLIEAGCDEAGRGCLAGPVVAAAVIFPKGYENEAINDSKQLSKKMRVDLQSIIKNDALAYEIGVVDHEKIDEINILNASFLAMHLALDEIKIKPEFLLIDGNRFKTYQNIPHTCIVKGDSKYLSIAAASILAKTYRDELMEKYHETYPIYNWKKNMGYPTAEHRKAVIQHGLSDLHRKSFKLQEKQLALSF